MKVNRICIPLYPHIYYSKFSKILYPFRQSHLSENPIKDLFRFENYHVEILIFIVGSQKTGGIESENNSKFLV